jgi:polyhydroxybutyrate depolymerase
MNLSLLLLMLLPANDAQLGPGDHTRSLDVDNRTRTYLVHVPPKYDPKNPAAVVLVFHGALTNAEIMARFTGLNEKADDAGFLAVYPNGTGRGERALTWNAGNCCGYASRNNVDDVAFVRALLDDLGKIASVDPKHIYATGISNGGMFCYTLASELSDRIAAIAPVSGTMGTETCDPKRAVPVIHFHGTADEFVPFKGGKGEKSLPTINFFSVDHSIRAWVKADGCKEEPATEELPDKAKDGTKVTRKTYGGGKDGAEVVLVVIEGGGHAWPGREARLGFLGKSTKNISANDLMWEFFNKHRLK